MAPLVFFENRIGGLWERILRRRCYAGLINMEMYIGLGTIIAAVLGLFWALYEHSTNSDRHPAKKDIVFRDVCAPEMKRLEDCVEIELRNVKFQIDKIDKKFDKHCEEIKSLIRTNGKKT